MIDSGNDHAGFNLAQWATAIVSMLRQIADGEPDD